jgi:DegV family protein with EDD domain
MKVAIVTDSTADLPSNLVEQYSIQVVPAILIIEGKSFEDGYGISRQEFYELLPGMKSPPTTAIPPISAFQKVYQRLVDQGFEAILSFHVAGQLSGMVDAARIAAASVSDCIRVIDSEQITLGLGFQVLVAAEAAAQNLTVDHIYKQAESVRHRVRLIAMLDTLEFVRRSGRVSWAQARIGSLLRIKPFLEVKDSKVLSLGQVRTRSKGIAHLMKQLKALGELERLAILHTNAEDDARQFLADLNPQLSTPPLIVNVTTIIGTHVGPAGLGFVAVVK